MFPVFFFFQNSASGGVKTRLKNGSAFSYFWPFSSEFWRAHSKTWGDEKVWSLLFLLILTNVATDTKIEHQNEYSILMMIIEVCLWMWKCTRVYALRGISSESLTCDNPVPRRSIPAKVHSFFTEYKSYFNVMFTKRQEKIISLL